MSWDLIHIQRKVFQGDDNWGVMYIKTLAGKWENLCFSYELPWKTFSSGVHQGKSKNSQSRIRLGVYEMKPRSDGAKGWRLELQSTEHRSNIQIHRSHKSMFIEGCILPVHFNNFTAEQITKGDPVIQTRSVLLMQKIKTRYDIMAANVNNSGNPDVTISATLPAISFDTNVLRA